MNRLATAALLAALGSTTGAASQTLELTGYYLNVGTAATSGPFNESGVSDFQRLRLMLSPDLGPISLDLAYEHGLELRSRATGSGVALGGGVSRDPGEWLPIQGDIETSERASWRHRLDRAALTARVGESAEITVGRQPISWATTLILTPADPFVPFDPEDPFREYRVGVDAARVRAFLGPFTDIDLVVRPAEFEPGAETVTALGRLRSVIGGVEVGGWLGRLHDEWAGSASVTATLGGAAARGEIVVREVDQTARVRLALGVDRSFTLAGRDLYVILEYQRDELGAAGPGELPRVIVSDPVRRGELLVLGRDAVALQAAYSIHPLWAVDVLALTNLGDPSLLLGPAASHSLGAETSLRAGIFVGLGAGATSDSLPGSEFGPVPLVGYASFTLFF